MVQLAEETRHDEINLTRLVQRLEQKFATKDWESSGANDIWINSLETLQTVRFAKKLLRNVEIAGATSKDSQRYDNIRTTLKRFETLVKAVEERSTPKRATRKSLLSSVPKPTPIALEPDPALQPDESHQAGPSLPSDNLLTSPSEPTPLPSGGLVSPIPTLIPPIVPTATKSTAVASGAFLENSKARHEAMSEQLAQMAVQLRKNAQHFSQSLAEDKAVVEETQEKLESNFGVMTKERIRLRDHRGKSGSTTCYVIFAVVAVTVVFVFMVALIRITGR